MTVKLFFWICISYIFYSYIGYPCLLLIWSKFAGRPINRRQLLPEPLVSIVIAARNEERIIGRRLDNLLTMDYPKEKMEIIVVSDGSEDETANIVKNFKTKPSSHERKEVNLDGRLKLLDLPGSRGKAEAINAGVSLASGDYIIFTDSRQEFDPQAIRALMANFSDNSVGGVSGALLFEGDSNGPITAEMGFYWNLEKNIRKMESKIGSVVGATGAIYAIRKSLFQKIPQRTILDDLYVPMRIVFQGYRVIFEEKAIAYDAVSKDFSTEKRRKVRTLFGNYQLLRFMPELLSPLKNPIFFKYISHKILRLFIPFFFISLILSSWYLTGILYDVLFYFLVAIMILPLFNKVSARLPYLNKLIKLGRTFIILNYFAVLAFLCLFRPDKKKIW